MVGSNRRESWRKVQEVPPPDAEPLPPPGKKEKPGYYTAFECDWCDKEFTGTRFKCARCDDFDVCEKCYRKRIGTKQSHKHYLWLVPESIRSTPVKQKKPPKKRVVRKRSASTSSSSSSTSSSSSSSNVRKKSSKKAAKKTSKNTTSAIPPPKKASRKPPSKSAADQKRKRPDGDDSTVKKGSSLVVSVDETISEKQTFLGKLTFQTDILENGKQDIRIADKGDDYLSMNLSMGESKVVVSEKQHYRVSNLSAWAPVIGIKQFSTPKHTSAFSLVTSNDTKCFGDSSLAEFVLMFLPSKCAAFRTGSGIVTGIDWFPSKQLSQSGNSALCVLTQKKKDTNIVTLVRVTPSMTNCKNGIDCYDITPDKVITLAKSKPGTLCEASFIHMSEKNFVAVTGISDSGPFLKLYSMSSIKAKIIKLEKVGTFSLAEMRSPLICCGLLQQHLIVMLLEESTGVICGDVISGDGSSSSVTLEQLIKITIPDITCALWSSECGLPIIGTRQGEIAYLTSAGPVYLFAPSGILQTRDVSVTSIAVGSLKNGEVFVSWSLSCGISMTAVLTDASCSDCKDVSPWQRSCKKCYTTLMEKFKPRATTWVTHSGDTTRVWLENEIPNYLTGQPADGDICSDCCQPKDVIICEKSSLLHKSGDGKVEKTDLLIQELLKERNGEQLSFSGSEDPLALSAALQNKSYCQMLVAETSVVDTDTGVVISY